MGSVFISYSHQDIIVDDIVNLFKENDILVWYDKMDLKVSDNWKRHIENAIKSSSCLVAFYSKNYDASNRCRTELDIARKVGKDIYIIQLDESLNSFSINEDYKNIQRPYVDLAKISPKYLFNILNNKNDFPRIFDSKISIEHKYDLTLKHVVFNQFLEDLKVKKHSNICDLIIDFIDYIKSLERKGIYISSDASLTDIQAIEPLDAAPYFILVNEKVFTKEKTDNSLRIVKILFWHLFNNGYSNISYNDNLNFDKIFIGSIQYALINQKINTAFTAIDLSKMKYHLFQASKASKFYENMKNGYKSSDVELSELILSICKETYLEKNPDININYDSSMAPSISDGTNIYSVSNICKNPLTFLLSRKKKDRDDVLLYGQPGSGKSALVIDSLMNLKNVLYLDLLKDSNLKNDLIKELIDSSSSFGYNIKFENLCNYSLLKRPVTLILDNIDYLDLEHKNNVINEINEYNDTFRFVISSNKRNLDGKISLSSGNALGVYYNYYEILKPSKDNFVAYLKKSLGETHPAVDYVTNLNDDNDFFTFFDSYDKAKILTDSLKKISSKKLNEMIEGNNNAFELYNKIFNGKEDYSIVKTINEFFPYEYADLSDLISTAMTDEINSLKEIAFTGNNILLQNLRFKKIDVEYSILLENNGVYSFFSDEIKAFFKASYINDVLRKKESDSSILLKVANEANTLKYLNYFEIVNYLTNGIKSIPDEIQLVLFKISEYNSYTAENFAEIATFTTIPDNCFKNFENVEEIFVPYSVNTIGRAAFCNMPRLKKVTINSDALELDIKSWAFINCPNLKEIEINGAYKKYNFPLFYACQGLKKITIKGDANFSTLDDGKLLTSKDHKNLIRVLNAYDDTLIIPDEIEQIEVNSCSFLTGLKKIIIGPNVKEIDSSFSDFCTDLVEFEAKSNDRYYSDKGILYTNNNGKKVLFRAPSAITDKLIINSDVNEIGDDSISTCYKIKEIIVPESVTEFSGYSFADTFNLERLEINGNVVCKDYVFLNAHNGMKIDVKRRSGNVRSYKLNEFIKANSSYEQKPIEIGKKTSVHNLFSSSFELCQEGTYQDLIDEFRIIRSMELDDNSEISGDNDEYNILIIGQTEYNMINSKPENQIKGLVRDIIKKNGIKAVIFTRDLPYIPQFFDFSDLKIVRTAFGSSKISKLLCNNVLKGGM